MKANELMIGDIVMAHYDDGEQEFDFPVVIDGIDNNSTLVDGTCQLSWKPLHNEHDWIEYAEVIEPIPLTEEILKANGWNIIHEKGANYIATKIDCHLIIVSKLIGGTPYIRIDHYWICDIPYVHDLQHALRLCGMNELADNFKIKLEEQ